MNKNLHCHKTILWLKRNEMVAKLSTQLGANLIKMLLRKLNLCYVVLNYI